MLSTRPSLDSPTRPSTDAPSPTLTKSLLSAGALLVIVAVVGQGQGLQFWRTTSPSASSETCEAIMRSDARIGREELAKLLTIPERDSKDNVRKVVSEPYCRLPAIQIRAGVEAEREVYPLAFDPSTHLILLYEGDEYAGYRFKVN